MTSDTVLDRISSKRTMQDVLNMLRGTTLHPDDAAEIIGCVELCIWQSQNWKEEK